VRAAISRAFASAAGFRHSIPARVVIDTLGWAAGKPKKYGDKMDRTVQPDFIPLDELRRRIEELKARRAAMEAQEKVTVAGSEMISGS
jgi:hypothetical protein